MIAGAPPPRLPSTGPASHALREHGGAIPRGVDDRGLRIADVLDLSVNQNPYGPHPAMLEAIRSAAVDRYPDPAASEARRALAAAAGVAADRVVLGAGAADLLWTLARALLSPGDAALVVEPTFAELRHAASVAGARVVEWRAHAGDGFAIDLDAVGERIAASRPALVYLGSPNNPTGAAVASGALADLARAHPRTWIALDESYVALGETAADAGVALPDNVVRVRSLTKEHAVPGVRVGYLVATVGLARRLEAARPAWATSTAAQAAAIAAASLEHFVAESRARLLADRERLARELRTLGLAPLVSRAAFFLLQAPRGDATALRDRLLARHRILVRDCSSFGLPGFVRVAARPAADAARLVEALRAELVAAVGAGEAR